MNRCTVVMPVHNEEACIGEACLEWLAALTPHGGRLLVIDDGSTDSTPRLLDNLAAEHAGISVLHKPNGGHGSAVLAGYREALRSGSDWIFQVDSDREMDAADFGKLWARRAEAEFVLGVREERSSGVRAALSQVHRTLVWLIFLVNSRDPNVPFRLMKAALVERLLRYVPADSFAPNVMLTILAARSGQGLLEVPVRYVKRRTGAPSFRGWRTVRIGVRWLGELARFRVGGYSRCRRGSAAE